MTHGTGAHRHQDAGAPLAQHAAWAHHLLDVKLGQQDDVGFLEPLGDDLPAKATDATLGLLVLASPDPQRFQSSMGTDLLTRIAELASAALSRLR